MGDGRYADYWKSTPSTWKRPDGPPRVWRVIDGRRKMPNGEIPRFSIQEVPEELKEDFIDFMVEYFIAEEVTSADKNLSNDPIGLQEIRTIWRNVLDQGVTIVALLVNTDPATKPVIAGGNFLNVVTVEDGKNYPDTAQFRSKGLRIVCETQYDMDRKVDVLKKYNIDKYLSSFGLGVYPDFRGQGLGEELLKARDDVGLAYKIPLTKTTFTGVASQTVAKRAGFESLNDAKYSELLDYEGNIAFPGVKVEFMKTMVKRLY